MKDFFGGLIGIIFFLIVACGWIMNIIALVSENEATGMALARVAGIFFFPLGVILGFV